MLRLLTYFALGSTLVVLWFVIEATGIRSPGCTPAEQTLIETPEWLVDFDGRRGEDTSPIDDESGGHDQVGQPSGDPRGTLGSDMRQPVSPVGALSGGNGLSVEADASTVEPETGERSHWTPPPDEPPLVEIVRPTAGRASDTTDELQTPDFWPPYSPESERNRRERPDVDALLGTYLEALRQLERESR